MRWIQLISLVTFLTTSVAFAEKTPAATEAWTMIKSGALVVDVRSADEFATGHLDGALNIPHDSIAKRAAELGTDKERQVVLYCKSGRRAGLAQQTLASLGFSKLQNAGGYQDLIDSKLIDSK